MAYQCGLDDTWFWRMLDWWKDLYHLELVMRLACGVGYLYCLYHLGVLLKPRIKAWGIENEVWWAVIAWTLYRSIGTGSKGKD